MIPDGEQDSKQTNRQADTFCHVYGTDEFWNCGDCQNLYYELQNQQASERLSRPWTPDSEPRRGAALPWRPPVDAVTVTTLRERLAAPEDPPQPIMEPGRYLGALHLDAGDGGIGKTWFELEQGLAVAAGAPEFAGCKILRSVPVIYANLELPPSYMTARLRLLAARYPGALDRVAVEDVPDLDLTSKGSMAWPFLQEKIRALKQRCESDGALLYIEVSRIPETRSVSGCQAGDATVNTQPTGLKNRFA